MTVRMLLPPVRFTVVIADGISQCMPEPAAYEDLFSRTERAECEVQDFLRSLAGSRKERCYSSIEELRKRGPELLQSPTYARRVTGGDYSGEICELRPAEYRIF